MEAVSRKVALDPCVDFDALARDTEGFSGADLQALVYNAQLEVIHETISATSVSGSSNNGNEDDQPIEYTIIGGPPESQMVKSRAEEAAFQQRVRFYRYFLRTKRLRYLRQLKRIVKHSRPKATAKEDADKPLQTPPVSP